MDKRLLTVVMAAILVALVITAIFYQITAGRRPVEAAVETRPLVVAKVDLPMSAVITPEDLREIDFPVSNYPDGGFDKIADVTERSVTQLILANEPVTKARVTDQGAGWGLETMIPEGYRAVAVAVNQVSGVSGFIMPGSDVDVLLSGMPRGGEERLTTTVLEKVKVISTGHRQQPSENGQPENVPVVNMLLTPEQAQLITLATQEGQIQLVLRNPLDEERTDKREITRARQLFDDVPPPPQPRAQRPAPRPAQVVQLEPPPPTTFAVEIIRGDKREVREIERSADENKN